MNKAEGGFFLLLCVVFGTIIVFVGMNTVQERENAITLEGTVQNVITDSSFVPHTFIDPIDDDICISYYEVVDFEFDLVMENETIRIHYTESSTPPLIANMYSYVIFNLHNNDVVEVLGNYKDGYFDAIDVNIV